MNADITPTIVCLRKVYSIMENALVTMNAYLDVVTKASANGYKSVLIKVFLIWFSFFQVF